ncbi:uncharacterized protein LOC124543813 isoform X2 [Vanessa cardui]|uniref:uncharacterized protein LOC124543813 isoform X2 n=1 Tax=Vanessa cardui TaxID=171605 RepID=UPI001F13C565|nr:uncharacterized protein LOC124543813 isoform X2 [Vanessa cardui]
MTKIILISVLLLQFTWCYAYPTSQGVGVYSYQDTAGNSFPRLRNRLFTRRLRPSRLRIFGSDIESQRLASHAARKAFDITYNHAGYNPNFFRLPQFTGSPFFGPGRFRANMDNNAHQSAFASAVVAPGYRRQIAAIDPINPGLPNVDVTSRGAEADNGNPNFVSVSSSSYASSANIDGKVTGMRGSETVVNENGKVTKYEVHS